MSSIDEIRKERLKKKKILEERGEEVYPAYTSKNGDAVGFFLPEFDSLVEAGKPIVVAGRVMSIREHGGSIFFDVYDGTGSLQAYLKRDDVEEAFTFFTEVVDRGDFLEVEGTPFITKKGERSILVSSWKMLTKSLLPIPDEWYGLKDDDERYRKRYLDILLQEDLRALFEKKALFWETMRHFMWKRKFLEVETPVLELTTGGAEARPFKTHHNDFDMDVFLRISVGELWQKRLMAGGFPRTFEIGRVFRNEGTSPEHLQEFTNMEFYAAYMNFEDGKELIKELYRTLATEVFGTTKFERKGLTFDLKDEWKDVDYVGTIQSMTGVNVLQASEKELSEKLEELGVNHEGKNRERLTDSLWKYCRKQIAGPAFLVNHPKFIAPLSKSRPDNPEVTFKFQVLLAGTEIGTGYSELNDPVDQKERFEHQQELLEAGDDEAMMPDWEFIEMLEHGMPPTLGFGCGERLFSTLAGVTIREAQLFPLMKPRVSEALSKKQAEARYRSKKFVVIADPSQGYGVTANAMGQLGISIGGFSKEQLFDTEILKDADGRTHYVDGLYPMTNLAGSQEEMARFAKSCYDAGIQFFDFSDIMRKAHSDEEMQKGYAEKKTSDIGYIAVGALVPADFEKEFLAGLKLFS